MSASKHKLYRKTIKKTSEAANLEIVRGFLITAGGWSLWYRIRLAWRVIMKTDKRKFEKTTKKANRAKSGK